MSFSAMQLSPKKTDHPNTREGQNQAQCEEHAIPALPKERIPRECISLAFSCSALTF